MNKSALLLFTCFSLYAHAAFCQYGNPGFYSSGYSDHLPGTSILRAYFGIDYPMMTLNMQTSYQIDRSSVPGNTLPNVDTTINISKKSPSALGIKNVIGFIGGLSFKLAKTSDNSILALDVATALDFYSWNIGTVKYSGYDSATGIVFCLQENLPIALMYKLGPEASLSRKDKTLFSIGAGFCPSVAFTSYDQTDGGYFKIRTFLVAELGINFGVALKLRATYYPSAVTFLNYSGNDLPGYTTNGNQTVTANGSGNFVLSLAIMLKSNRWNKDEY